MREKPIATIIGAGAVGRGLIAPVLIDSGYRVVFIDVNRPLVDTLNTRRWYPLAGRGEVRWIGPVRAEAFSDYCHWYSDIIFVSVKAQNLEDVSHTIATLYANNAYINRTNNVTDASPMRVYVIENLSNARDKFAKMLMPLVAGADDGYAQSINIRNGIANVVVPISPFEEDDPSFTVYDPNMELVLEEWKFDRMDGVKPVDKAKYVDSEEFEFQWDLKLYLHCSVHVITAYIGIHRGLEYIHETIECCEDTIGLAVEVISDMLKEKYPDRVDEIDARVLFEIESMGDELMMDDVYRVARDPIRKLMPDDRIIGLISDVNIYLDMDQEPGYLLLYDIARLAVTDSGLTKDEIMDTWGIEGKDMIYMQKGVLDYIFLNPDLEVL